MQLLLDTNALLWWLEDSPRVGRQAREAIADPANQVFVSAASTWEIAIKASIGRLPVPGPLADWLPQVLPANRFTGLPVQIRHTLAVAGLPLLHADPFDRLLIAQAQVERLTLVSGDERITQYAVDVIRC